MRIKHWLVNRRYVCNQACNTTYEKSAKFKKDVTCLNCLDYFKRVKKNESKC